MDLVALHNLKLYSQKDEEESKRKEYPLEDFMGLNGFFQRDPFRLLV